VHLTMFGGFVFLWNLYLTNKSLTLPRLLGLFFLFYMLSNFFGISMEIVQKYWIPGRDYDPYDIIADMFGAGIGFGVSGMLFIPSLVKEAKNKPL
jgi:VanZ family protein